MCQRSKFRIINTVKASSKTSIENDIQSEEFKIFQWISTAFGLGGTDQSVDKINRFFTNRIHVILFNHLGRKHWKSGWSCLLPASGRLWECDSPARNVSIHSVKKNGVQNLLSLETIVLVWVCGVSSEWSVGTIGHKDLVSQDRICERYPGLTTHLDIDDRAQFSMPLGHSFTRQITQRKHVAYIWIARSRDRDVLKSQFSLLSVAIASWDQSIRRIQESSGSCNANDRHSFIMLEALRHVKRLNEFSNLLHTMLICKEKWKKDEQKKIYQASNLK